MARILCIDYGKKRCGIAATDPLQIVATSQGMVETPKLMDWLKIYIAREEVERLLIGYPLNTDGSATHATPLVQGFVTAFQKQFPALPVEKLDERYSSKLASAEIAQMGLKKKVREKKGIIDEVAAVMLLQEWLLANKS